MLLIIVDFCFGFTILFCYCFWNTILLTTEQAPQLPLQLRPRACQWACAGPACPRGLRCAPRRPPAAALARRPKTPGGGGVRPLAAVAAVEQVEEGRRGRPCACCRPPAGRRGPDRAHAAGAGPSEVACRGAPTLPPQMRPRARQRAAQSAQRAGSVDRRNLPTLTGSRSDRVLLNVPARDSAVIQDEIHALYLIMVIILYCKKWRGDANFLPFFYQYHEYWRPLFLGFKLGICFTPLLLCIFV
jgi:hypothetical protein